MENKIILDALLAQKFDDRYVNDLLRSLTSARQEIEYQKECLSDDKADVDKATKELYKAIVTEDFENLPLVKDNYDKLSNEYRKRLEIHYEALQSYQKIYDELEELIDYDEEKAKKSLKSKCLDEKSLATFKVCRDFISALLRFYMIISGKAYRTRYEPVTSRVWRVSKIKVEHKLATSVEDKRLLGLDKMSDKSACEYIHYLLSDVDLAIDNRYKNWRTEDIKFYSHEINGCSDGYGLNRVYVDCSSPRRLTDVFWLNYRDTYLAKDVVRFQDAKKYQETCKKLFYEADEAYNRTKEELTKALEESRLEKLKELMQNCDELKLKLVSAQKKYSESLVEKENAQYCLSSKIDYDDSDALLDYQNECFNETYTEAICTKLLISMVRVFQIKKLGNNSQYYSQITSKIWRMARLNVIYSVSSNPRKKYNLGLGEMNDGQTRKYLRKLLEFADYHFRYYELRDWKEKEVYIYGWRRTEMGKKLLELDKLDEPGKDCLNGLYDEIETYICENTRFKLEKYFDSYSLKDSIKKAYRLMDGRYCDYDLSCAYNSEQLAEFITSSEGYLHTLRLSLWESGVRQIIEVLDTLDDEDNPWNFMWYDF